MSDQKGTIIELTEEQKEQMRRATGTEHETIKVENVGSQLAPRITPGRKRLTLKANAKAGARVSPKMAAKRANKIAAKVAAKRNPKVAAKVAAKRSPKIAAKRSPKIAAKRSPKIAAKRATKQ